MSKQTIYLTFIFLCCFYIRSHSETIALSDWHYFKGLSQPNEDDAKWYDSNYNDASWDTGNAPFRYGDGAGGTLLNDMQNNYTSFYLRTSFVDTSTIETINFIYDFDDGFILYFNGTELFSRNAPNVLSHTSEATAFRESGFTDSYVVRIPQDLVYQDTNVIAVQVFNRGIGSSDIYFDLQLRTTKPLPQALAPFVDTPGGRFSEPFSVNIYPLSSGDSVYYTLDGSDPERSPDAVLCTEKTQILIDPSSTVKRGSTPGVVLSMKTIRTGYHASPLISNTYLFVDKVKTQSYPGWKWPNVNINGQIFDYEMDPEVVNDPRYTDSIDMALSVIPSLMLTLDYEDLFDESTGIYVNAGGHGYAWERPGNLELIGTDGVQKFRVGAGVRMRGGSSRNGNNPKHSFRFFFRSEYGDSKLNYPLFGDEGTDSFDKIDLRTAQNYSWSFKGDALNTLNRDVFSRDIQKDMNQPYTRSRYYHLYVNGLYFGVYQTQERSEARFAESYFGGDSEDYDVIKVARDDNKRVEATDGNLDAWKEVYDICEQGFSDIENYYRLIGLNKDGVRDTALPVLVDIDNLIDYMMIIFISGNYDAPVSQFFRNDYPNNFYGIYDRKDKDEGYKFFAHDSEHTLKNVNENRVNIAHLDINPMEKPAFEYFHPQWLHHQLTFNTRYRMRFADRAYDLLYNDGVLTPEANRNRFMASANMLQLPIMAESARWGDAKKASPLNKQDHWIPTINSIANNYFKLRTDVVISQLKEEGLLPKAEAPQVFENSFEILANKWGMTQSMIEVRNASSAGDVFYTNDSSDPMLTDGTVSLKATKLAASVMLNIQTITLLKARSFVNDEWSPLREIFLVPLGYDVSALKLTEIHYHPVDSLDLGGKQFEFIEIKNTGDKSVDLMGVSFEKGIKFTFENHLMVAPGAFVVLASNAEAFSKMYGKQADGEYKKSLSNSGEILFATDALDKPLFSLTYNDKDPWPVLADGLGYSMVSYDLDPKNDPSQSFYWRNSYYIGGSPFANDVVLSNELIQISDVSDLIVYPNPAKSRVVITGKYLFGSEVNVTIVSMSGIVCGQSRVSASNYIELDLEPLNLPNGLYILQVQSNNSTRSVKVSVQN